MNRIQLCDVLAVPHTSNDGRFQETPLVETPRTSFEHSVFVPLHYEPKYAYPLIVWLHGPGDDQTQLKKILPLVSMRNYVGISPCATRLVAGERSTPTYRGYRWEQDPTDIMACEERVIECIDKAMSRFNIDRSRVFIAGYDSGGTMAIRMATMRPELFAGVASIGGSFPQGFNPLRRIESTRRFPVLMIHGRDSSEYRVPQACDDLKLMHMAGLSVSLRQYPCEQEVTTTMLSDVNRWLMEIVTGERQNNLAQHDPRSFN